MIYLTETHKKFIYQAKSQFFDYFHLKKKHLTIHKYSLLPRLQFHT